MPNPTKLCSTCLNVLQSGLEEMIGKDTYIKWVHHASFADFKEAAAQNCFICRTFWDSLRDEILASWQNGTLEWRALKCGLVNRTWAAEYYDPIYLPSVFFQFSLADFELANFKYPGGSFCLVNKENVKTDKAENDTNDGFESSTSSATVHKLAHKWYTICRESHETCKRIGPDKQFTPTRLVDVGVDGDENWKLCVSSEEIVDSPNYLTLSYRWAKDPTILLQRSNIQELRKGAPISTLPKTFRDAIVVARSFSIRYLWIDSLCIVQDSSEDWARESVLMHEVYTNSSCNIAASASEGPEGGLFRSRNRDEIQLPVGYINVDLPTLGIKMFNIWDPSYMDRLIDGPLVDRGWIFQERVLPPRVLHFSRNQIAWECLQMNRCETFPNRSPYHNNAKTFYSSFDTDSVSEDRLAKNDQERKTMNSTVYFQWISLLGSYSKCKLTYPDDRLVAMEGIANMFQRYTGDEYLAGLWRSRLVEGLSWVVTNPVARPSNQFRVPSWSWAAVDSDILPLSVNISREDYLIEVIHVNVELPEVPSGCRQIPGFITLRGCLTKATIQEGPRQISNAHTSIKLLGFPSKCYVFPDTTHVVFSEGAEVYMLPHMSQLNVSIKKLGTNPEGRCSLPRTELEGILVERDIGGNHHYRRIGRFAVDELDHIQFFGLRAFPRSSRATEYRYNIAVEKERTSLITIV